MALKPVFYSQFIFTESRVSTFLTFLKISLGLWTYWSHRISCSKCFLQLQNAHLIAIFVIFYVTVISISACATRTVFSWFWCISRFCHFRWSRSKIAKIVHCFFYFHQPSSTGNSCEVTLLLICSRKNKQPIEYFFIKLFTAGLLDYQISDCAEHSLPIFIDTSGFPLVKFDARVDPSRQTFMHQSGF